MGFFSNWGRKKKSNRELSEEKALKERDNKLNSVKEQEQSTQDYLCYSSLYGERGEVDPKKSFQLNRGYGFDPASSKAKVQRFADHHYRPQDLQSDQQEKNMKETETTPRIRRPF